MTKLIGIVILPVVFQVWSTRHLAGLPMIVSGVQLITTHGEKVDRAVGVDDHGL
jgi:hypothetical protein